MLLVEGEHFSAVGGFDTIVISLFPDMLDELFSPTFGGTENSIGVTFSDGTFASGRFFVLENAHGNNLESSFVDEDGNPINNPVHIVGSGNGLRFEIERGIDFVGGYSVSMSMASEEGYGFMELTNGVDYTVGDSIPGNVVIILKPEFLDSLYGNTINELLVFLLTMQWLLVDFL